MASESKATRTQYSDGTKAEVLAAIDSGMSRKNASAQFKINYKVLCQWINRHEKAKQKAEKLAKKRLSGRTGPTKVASHVSPLGTRYSDETKAEVLEALDSGLTWLEAATKFKVGYSTVRTWGNEHEAAKARKTHRVGKGNRHTSDTKAEVFAAVDAGMPWRKAAEKFGVAFSTVRSWVIERAANTPTVVERPSKAASKPATSTGIVVVSGHASGEALTVNKRLRLTLAALLQRTDPVDTFEKLGVQNERLQVVIDLLLGVE